MISGFNRRLAVATTLSVALHLLVIVPLRLPIDSSEDALQRHLQASLSRTPPARVPAEKNTPKPKQQPPAPPAKRLTAPHGANYSAPPDEPPTPATEEENLAEPLEALVLDQPLLPEYPAAALAEGLEGCVLASVQVNAAGEVDSVSILAADHPGVFDQSVIDAQKSARYAPARQGAQAIPSRVLAVAAFVVKPGKQLDCPLRYVAQAAKLIGAKTP